MRFLQQHLKLYISKPSLILQEDIGNSEQPDSNKRNVSESYYREMNELLERCCIFTQDTE